MLIAAVIISLIGWALVLVGIMSMRDERQAADVRAGGAVLFIVGAGLVGFSAVLGLLGLAVG